MDAINETGTGWFRSLGQLFIGGESTVHYGGMRKTEWRIGLNIGARTFEWTWVAKHYGES